MKKQIKQDASESVLVGGCFDVIHYGHIRFLTRAKAMGNELVVALESDENVRRMKGEKRPIHTQKQRAAMLREIRVVDRIILLPPMKTDAEYAGLVTRIHPAVIAATAGDPVLVKKKEHAARIGAVIRVIPRIRTPSTSQLAKLLGLE